jgi:hypothetical protein
VTRWQRSEGVVWRRSSGKVLVLGPQSDGFLMLSGTGAVTWELLAEPIGEEELVGLLAEGFHAQEEDVADTLRPFLAGLAKAGVASSSEARE